jgi:hypothetical protein
MGLDQGKPVGELRTMTDRYIYNADVYCEACARDIKARIRAEGNEPENPDDETSYDSRDWPKGPFNDEERNCPEHCGSGPDCLEPHIFPSGFKAGKFLGGSLTTHGVEYVKETHRDRPSEVTKFWIEEFDIAMPEIVSLEDWLGQFTMDQSCYDEETSRDCWGDWACIIRGPLKADEIRSATEDCGILDADDAESLTTMKGLIFMVDGAGFRFFEVYDDSDQLEDDWGCLVEEWEPFDDEVSDDDTAESDEVDA